MSRNVTGKGNTYRKAWDEPTTDPRPSSAECGPSTPALASSSATRTRCLGELRRKVENWVPRHLGWEAWALSVCAAQTPSPVITGPVQSMEYPSLCNWGLMKVEAACHKCHALKSTKLWLGWSTVPRNGSSHELSSYCMPRVRHYGSNKHTHQCRVQLEALNKELALKISMGSSDKVTFPLRTKEMGVVSYSMGKGETVGAERSLRHKIKLGISGTEQGQNGINVEHMRHR